MDLLWGWGLVLLVIVGLTLLIRATGMPEEARPSCGVQAGSDGPQGGCH